MDVNEERLNSFMGKMIGDVGAAMNASLMLLGDKLGLYRALAQGGPMNAAALAKATGTAERYIQEWLSAQAASGYIEYDKATGQFSMLPEQALALADEDSPVFLGAVGSLVGATFLDEPKITDAFKTGKGVGWNRRSECLFCGTARFFRTSYKHYLVQEWLPALEGVVDEAEERRCRRRRRLRARRLDATDGGGVPEINVLRLRLSRRLDRDGAEVCAGGGIVGPRSFRNALRQDIPGQGL
ncbi:hypothetical protein ABIF25_008308 [Bradyrhizobium elkanii]